MAFIFIIIIFGLFLIFGGFKSYPSYAWKQKLELVIETPDGNKTGSAVVKASVGYSAKTLPEASSVHKRWSGEATVVDLGGGKYIFALVREPVSLAQDTFRYLVPADKKFKEGNTNRYPTGTLFPRFVKEIREKAPVVSKYYFPKLVTFDDVDDPASVKLVDPNDLSAIFGEGYVLKEMTLEITDEDAQSGKMKSVLNWIDDETAPRIGGKTNKLYGDPLYGLGRWDFIKK